MTYLDNIVNTQTVQVAIQLFKRWGSHALVQRKDGISSETAQTAFELHLQQTECEASFFWVDSSAPEQTWTFSLHVKFVQWIFFFLDIAQVRRDISRYIVKYVDKYQINIFHV